jgi:hypothetical protein
MHEEIAMIVPRPAPPGRCSARVRTRALRLLWPASFLLLAACATRAVPDRFPESAAASPAAAVPKPAEVTRSLRDDPGAADLAASDASAPAHQHGGHPHAH